MSEEEKQGSRAPSAKAPDAMTDRLASLRASILASKNRTPAVPKVAAADAPAEMEPTPAAAEPDEPASGEDEAPAAVQYTADPTEIEAAPAADADEAAEAPLDEAPAPAPEALATPLTESTTGDLHRVTPPGDAASETPEHDEPAEPDNLATQMDEASEAASLQSAEQSAPDFSGPTVVQRVADIEKIEGTPLYMSPEQCRNDAVTAATDVYSLGVMMFQLLERQPPYLGLTIEEVIVKHLDAPVPDQTSPFTPDDVRDIIGRMLAKDPAQRPDTGEIIEVLQRHVTISGPDVQGLEEESWSVSDISSPASDAAPAPVQAPTQLTGEHDAAPAEAEGPAKKPPVWVFGLIALAVVAVLAAVFLAGGGDKGTDATTPEGEAVRTAEPAPTEPEAVAEPTEAEPSEEAPVAAEEPTTAAQEAEAEPAGEMEFGGDEPAAEEPAAEEPAAEEPAAEEPVAEEPVAEEPVKEEPKAAAEEAKPKKKKPRTKKPKIRELRLEL